MKWRDHSREEEWHCSREREKDESEKEINVQKL